MNINQARERIAEIGAIIYWHNRGTFPKAAVDVLELQAEKRTIEESLARGLYEQERNERGNVVKRMQVWDPNGCSNTFWARDVILEQLSRKWMQFPTRQDAHYYGIWYSFEMLAVATYAEGDLTIVIADDVDHFVDEIDAIQKWNLENGWCIVDIDLKLFKEVAQQYH